jgi:hypothetical protein
MIDWGLYGDGLMWVFAWVRVWIELEWLKADGNGLLLRGRQAAIVLYPMAPSGTTKLTIEDHTATSETTRIALW